MQLAYIISNEGNITVVLNSKNFSIGKSHPNYQGILEAIGKHDTNTLSRLLDVKTAIVTSMGGSSTVTVKDGQVFYKDLPIHNNVTERILNFIRQNLDTKPLIRFLENAFANPVPASIDELWDFLSHQGFPITEDGCFIGYKGVASDWMDKHTHTIRNQIGDKPSMDRSKVDPNRRNECSQGLHVGTLEYARGFASQDNGEHIVLVKVNPKDCIAVPKDHDCSKLRVCEYEVIGEAEKLIEEPMYPMPQASPEPSEEEWCEQLDVEHEPEDETDEFGDPTWLDDDEDESEDPASPAEDFEVEDEGRDFKPKRPPCSFCQSKGGKKHARSCKRPRKS